MTQTHRVGNLGEYPLERWWTKPRNGLWLITGLTALIYANSMYNSFHYDDFHSIVNNPWIRSLKLIPFFFTSGSVTSESIDATNYRPLLYTTYVLNYALGGYKPWGYHLVNLAFHLLSVCLLYLIVRRLVDRTDAALLASLIFAIHPLNSEAINYITARSTVMSSSLMLLSLLSFMIYRSSSPDSSLEVRTKALKPWRSGQAWLYYVGSLFTLVLALLTKETALILPGLFLLYDLCFFFPSYRKSVLQGLVAYLPLLATFGLGLWVRGQVLGRSLIFFHPEKAYSAFLTTLNILTEYLSLLIWPFPLSIDHNLMTVRSLADPGVILSLVLITGLVIAGLASFRSFRLFTFCIFWLFLVLSPLAALPFFTNVALFQENRGYLAVIPFSILLAWWIGRRDKLEAQSSKQKFLIRMKWGFICLVLVAYGGIDLHRNTIWADDLTVWSDAVEKSPNSTTSHYNLGLAYQKMDRWEDSIQIISEILKTDPRYPKAYYNLGVAYTMTGKLDLAEMAYRAAISHNPRDYKAYFNVGRVYEQQGRLELAIGVYQETLKIDPNNARAYNNLAFIYQQRGDLDNAIQMYRTALNLDPGYTKARHNLAIAYEETGDFDGALRELRSVLRSDPDSAMVHYHLGQVYERLAQKDLAIEEYQTALKINPSREDARLRLTNLLQGPIRQQKAIEQP